MVKTRNLFLISCLFFIGNGNVRAQKPDFHDVSLSDSVRVETLLSELTLDEKMALLSTDLAVPRLGIPHCGHYEGLHGLALGGPAAWGGKKKDENGKIVPTDCYTTIFPQAYGLGATWDSDLIEQVADQIAEEARYYMQREVDGRKSLVMRAPNADLARDPRWGRTEECFGEDPYLVARLTVAMVKGLQGHDARYWKTASLMKHFLANSNEDGRDSTSSNFDERLFYEYYAYPFYKGITEGGSRAFMAAYNSWNGIPMMIHPCLLDVARKRWGQNGIICSDGGALNLLIEAHHSFPTRKEGAAATVKASVGQILDSYLEDVKKAVDEGLLSEEEIDDAIRGNLFVALKLGLLDGDQSENPYSMIGKDSTALAPYEKEEVRSLARKVMSKSVVLLKNDTVSDGTTLLPLQLDKIGKIALIGPYADRIVQDWYSGTPSYEITILDGLRSALPEGVQILYAKDNAMGKAEKIAEEADLVVVCTGNHPYGTKADWKFCPVPSDGREAVDRKSLLLPDEDMIRQLYKANPNTILVLVSSFPYAINWCQKHLPAIVHITHCCQEQGNGLADVLTGKVNPAGRTTQTWVNDITDLPDMMDYDIRNGRTYMYYRGDVLYPFGFGLSYTNFEYRNVKSIVQENDRIKVNVCLRNVGSHDGEEVVQLYVAYPESKVERPDKQLRAFKRIALAKGESKVVTLEIDKMDLGYWNTQTQSFELESGRVDLLIGSSSEDIRLKARLDL
ncbi:glycoside hydrolase family 3 C-terminal domain-containing protein [uncultured Bacteroides sp.]|uniref:glycoside hydrolase family 3 C-terminal domain-containing protein n=1 Tax=uncultured Bacteroides sp. TaxID=162156 RepID=UPI0026088A88|nr:glycoside hydrolase family 3 C-terminal domain-containing protein [uncultured Bacteroides sp.]